MAVTRVATTKLESGDEGLVVGQVRVHDLEGDDAIEAQIGGLVDGGHPAAGKQGEDLIAAVDERADQAALPRRLHLCESRLAPWALRVATPAGPAPPAGRPARLRG